MADPTGWTTPETAWLTTDGILNTDLIRIENNILILKDLLYTYSGTFQITVPTPYFTAATTVTVNYHIVNKMVYISIPSGLESPGQSANAELQISPTSGAWPSQIVPQYDTIVPCVFKNNRAANYHMRPGYLLVSNSSTTNWVGYITNRASLSGDDGYYYDQFFYDASGSTLKKALPAQSIWWMVENTPQSTTTTTTTTTSAP